MTGDGAAAVAVSAATVGFMVTLWARGRAAGDRVQARFEDWRRAEGRRAVQESVRRGRPGHKAGVDRALAERLPGLTFAAGDVRFIGHPVLAVVFEGHGALAAGTADHLDAVHLLTGPDDGGQAGRHAAAVAECVAAGRIRWVTWHVDVEPVPGDGSGRRR